MRKTRLPALGAPAGGGFFAGLYLDDKTIRRLYVAGPDGEFRDVAWNSEYSLVKGALSYVDGLANTRAMARAGSQIAKTIAALRIGGHDDWCLMSHAQAFTALRSLKFDKAGAAMLKKKGGGPFADAWYWTSTQYAAYGNGAWAQSFRSGTQDTWLKGNRYFARAVRSEIHLTIP